MSLAMRQYLSFIKPIGIHIHQNQNKSNFEVRESKIYQGNEEQSNEENFLLKQFGHMMGPIF